MSFLKNLFSKKNIFALVVIVILLFQIVKLSSIGSKMDYLEERDSSLITEIGQMKDAYTSLGDDLNEVRKFLLLPTKDYLSLSDVPDTGEATNGDKNTNSVELALFKYIDYLAEQDKKVKDYQESKAYLDHLKNSELFKQFLSDNGLKIGTYDSDENSTTLRIDLASTGLNLVFFTVDLEESDLVIRNIIDSLTFTPDSKEDFENQVRDYISRHKDKILTKITELATIYQQIETTIASQEIQDVLNRKGMSFGEKYEKDLTVYYPINNSSSELIGEIVLDLSTQDIHLVDKDFDSEGVELQVSDISKSLTPFLEDLDASTIIETKVREAKDSLESSFKDSGFKLMLKENGLSVDTQASEDEDRYWYKIYDSEGNHISSIVIEKATAVINIVDLEGTNSENLLFFDPVSAQKKTLEIPGDVPEYDDSLSHEEGTYNILIAGKHGNLVDTMIFAHVDEKLREVRMISIPRDLHYNGRKINALPYFYGMPELKKVLSELSGYELDKYVLIDMYAFIDVIDLIGGIDVHLDQPVIDPTYRTVDNGIVGTLHYEPGDYHLGGKEALRLARSRHTSSDFARAERQQLILQSIQEKAKSFGFGDADTFYEIAKSVLNQTETDVTLDEAVALYFRYQNFEIVSNNVMSSGNVLYVPPYTPIEQCRASIAEAEANGAPIPSCMDDNHAYTLLPRDNNWNLIKWYFKENFESDLSRV
ncbi:hypothetical protein GF354_05545 [Candidatus Peregrinibacteria bacterium]|nr:hypothetical protein [Candidatus Peregrinibacteria bacterium]